MLLAARMCRCDTKGTLLPTQQDSIVKSIDCYLGFDRFRRSLYFCSWLELRSFNLSASFGMHQVDSYARGRNVIDDVAASVGDGRCAALALCGTLDECGGSAEDWALLAKELPADLLLFSNTVATDFTAVAVQETGRIIQRLIGSVDILWTDVVGLFQLFNEDGEEAAQIAAAVATQSGDKTDENAMVIDLLQCMVGI